MFRSALRSRTWVRSLVAGVAVGGIVLGSAAVLTTAASAEDSSTVTVGAREQASQTGADIATAPFPDLKLTVSQTKDLVEQAITVSWEGGKRSTLPTGQTGGENYLQLMQCWGDAAGGGPDRTTCQYGGFPTEGARRSQTNVSPVDQDKPYSAKIGDLDYTGIPFRSANGKTVQNVYDGRFVRIAADGNRLLDEGGGKFRAIDADGKYLYTIDRANMPEGWEPPPVVDLNNNEFFTQYTTNEVPWAGSGADGRGSVTFEAQTVLSSYGLGCGAVPEGASSGRSCWLVAVPRGAGNNVESGLAWSQWQYRVAVKLDFQAIGQRCALGATERQLAGSELPADAVASWQPGLCASPTGNAYTLLKTTDADAAAEANVAAGAPLAVTSRALDTSSGAVDALTYAPVALTSVVVSFAIDRSPIDSASPEVKSRARQPFSEMKLTPRLLAKLMTSSYLNALPIDADRSHLRSNPRDLLKDPDFLAVNAADSDWAQQAISGAIADVMVPQGRSDALRAVWDYILADAEARDFLAGVPDPHGMIVNPYASTDPAKNPTGAGLDLPRSDAPKVDPSEAFSGTPRALNSVTVRPYMNDLAAGSYYALRGDGLTLGAWDEISVPNKWTRASRSLVGDRAVIALSDSAAAERYETVTASLRNPAGQFVKATADSMVAASAAMTASTSQPQVLGYDPSSPRAAGATTAYPLTVPVYAATNAALGDDKLRASYADFIRYAVDSQNPGPRIGDLPAGFAPLPDSWREQALTAANAIEDNTTPKPFLPSPQAAANGGGSPASVGNTAPQAAANAAAAPADPAATGRSAGALSGGKTGADPDLSAVPAAIPVSLAAGALAAAAVPLVGRFRRPDDL